MKTKLTLFMVFAFVGTVCFAQSIPAWRLEDLRAEINAAKQPTVINFWATFCKPCIAELPHFQSIVDRYKSKGVTLIMVSLDLREAYSKKVASFAKKLKLTSSVVWLDESNADAFCPVVDSSWSGAIPATIFINNAKGYRRFFEEELSKVELEAEIKKMID